MATATKEAPEMTKEARKTQDRFTRMADATEAAGLTSFAAVLRDHAEYVDKPRKGWTKELDDALVKDTGDGEKVDLRYGVARQAVAFIDRFKQGVEDPDLLGDLLYRPVFMAERVDAKPKPKKAAPEFTRDELEAKKKDELVKLAVSRDVSIPTKATKAQVVDALLEATA